MEVVGLVNIENVVGVRGILDDLVKIDNSTKLAT